MKPLLILTGPTASGKSALALEIASQIGSEILCADSMQIYRGCDIATAKPTPAERAAIPHHLLDLCDPDERFSAAQWAQRAREAISEIEERGNTPIVCGGTGFYLKALLEPDFLASTPPDPEFRAVWDEKLAQNGPHWLHEELQKLDPIVAARLHANDSFRVLRAIEVALNGETSGLNTAVPFDAKIFALEWPREVLNERINARVDAMLAQGFCEELRSLGEKWGREAPALQSVGYRQMLPVLLDGAERNEGIERWKIATRQYAKRQRTYFRHQLPVVWMDGARPAKELAGEILG